MDKFEKLDAVLAEQYKITAELKNEIDLLKRDDLFGENENLRRQIAELSALQLQLAGENERIAGENKRLKNELYEQLFNEKIRLAELSDKRLDAYYASAVSGERNRMYTFECVVKERIDELRKQLEQNRLALQNPTYTKLREMQEEVGTQLLALRQAALQAEGEVLAAKTEGMKQLKNEPLTEEEIARRGKQNNVEALLGLKLFNRLGIVLIIIGVIAAARFTYAYIPDVLKGALIYLLGLVMLTTGELLSRKKSNVFSLGLTSGGVAVLYAATALCFFLLEILSMLPAISLCVLTTALAFILSRRYNSQTIAAFALVGGYLPLLSVAPEQTLIYFAIGYFILLNIFALSIAVIKKWHAVQFIGFALNIGATAYVASQLYALSHKAAAPVAVLYVFFSFVVYTVIPIASTYRSKSKMGTPDNTLLSLNTIFGSAAIFTVFQSFGLWDWAGLMSAGFCLFYLFAALLLKAKMHPEKTCRVLFAVTGLTFAVLAVPLQFDIAYLSLGWLVEGVLLLCYGIYKNQKPFRIAGWIVSGLCLFVFLSIDIPLGGTMFFAKYLFVTAGSLLITGSMMAKRFPLKSGGKLFRCLTALNLWFFLLFAIHDKFFLLLSHFCDSYSFNFYLTNSLSVIVSLVYAYAIVRIKPIADKPVRGVSVGITVITVLWLFLLNAGDGAVYTDIPLYTIIGTSILVITNLLAVFAVRDLLQRIVLKRRLGIEWYPVALSSFFVFILTQNLTVTLNLAVNSVIITVVFALTSLGWILFGFLRRYQVIRLFGLGLSFITIIKLFLVDLSFLTEGMRIVSYFAMGIILLAISFVYQYFSKRLEKRIVETQSQPPHME